MTPSPETRLTPIPFAEWDDHTRDVLLPHLRRPERYLSGAPDAPPMPVVMELFAHHLPLSETWLAFSNMLASDQSTLEGWQRELLILRVAWRTQSGYEWDQHSRMGRDEGLTDEQLRAVTEGPAAEVWTPFEQALVSAVDEVIDGFGVSDETWESLAGFLGPDQVFELLFVIGGYLCMAGVLNSVGLRGDPPAAP
jgi:4-carboxymuconolactone decarboxylase